MGNRFPDILPGLKAGVSWSVKERKLSGGCVDDETDYDNDVFDPGDCDDMDDAM